MPRFLLPTAMLAGTLVLGCGEQPAITEPASAPQTLRRTEQNLTSLGAEVIRGSPGAWLMQSDPDPAPGLTALIGWTFAELEQACAGGEPASGALEELIVIRPHSTEELPDLHQVVRGAKAPLLVWEATIPFIDPIGELCGELLPLPHLTGTGNFMRTDNDLITTGTRGNAFHEGIHGQVTSEAGERFRFSAKFHGVILPSGDERFTNELQLDPIGS